MFPYHDENTTQRTPVITIAIIVANALMWLLVQGAGSAYALAASVCDLGLIPGEVTGLAEPGTRFEMGDGLACLVDAGPQWHTILSSMFLHGSWMHLIGNMWFLWLFGNNIEDSMTRGRFLVFYLLCGLGAAAAQVLANPASIVPMVGASGAISGVMGAYLLIFPKVKVWCIVPLGIIPIRFTLPAWTMLLYWLGMQVLGGSIDLAKEGGGGGVAFWAHVGGFAAGLILIKLFTKELAYEAHKYSYWEPKDRTRFGQGGRW